MEQIRCRDETLTAAIAYGESSTQRDGDGRQFRAGRVGNEIADHGAAFANHGARHPVERRAQSAHFIANDRGEAGLFLPDQGSHADVIRKYLDPVKVGNAIDVDHEARPNAPLYE